MALLYCYWTALATEDMTCVDAVLGEHQNQGIWSTVYQFPTMCGHDTRHSLA